MANEYSSDKAIVHLEQLIQLREKRQPYPVHVQIIPSDYCNQNCSFCFPAGTLVLTESGYTDIIDIDVGQRVFDENKDLQCVLNVFSRLYAGNIVCLKLNNCLLRCTPEHPIFVKDKGYVNASEIIIGDNLKSYVDHDSYNCVYLEVISRYEENYNGMVYNLSIENTESYIADNVVVHNCAYRMSGYSSNQLFKVIENGVVDNNPKRMIPLFKLSEIAEDLSAMKVKAVQLSGGGEPTVHPHFYEFAKNILDRNISLAVVTNGLLLNEKRAELLANSAWIRISIDCGNAESYSKIRDVPKEEFNIVKKNIQRLSKMKRSTVLGVGFVITNSNFHELYEGCKQFKEWGADNVRISALFQNDGANYFKDIHQEILEQISKCKELSDNTFKVFDNFGSRFEDLELGNPDYTFCPYMNFTTYIGGDQNVYTCCVNSYNVKGLIGSIKNQRFKELWDSAAKQGFFDNFDASKCTRCMFNEKNKYINNILRKPTVHDNFV